MAGTAQRWTVAMVTVALGVSALGACTKDTGSEKAFCAEVERIPSLDSVVTGFAETERSTLEARLDDAEVAYDNLSSSAPGEIRGSVNEMVALVDAVLAGFRSHPDDPEAAADEIRAVVKEHPGAATASLKVVSYASEHCDIDLNPTTDEPADPAGPSSTSTP